MRMFAQYQINNFSFFLHHFGPVFYARCIVCVFNCVLRFEWHNQFWMPHHHQLRRNKCDRKPHIKSGENLSKSVCRLFGLLKREKVFRFKIAIVFHDNNIYCFFSCIRINVCGSGSSMSYTINFSNFLFIILRCCVRHQRCWHCFRLPTRRGD